MSGVPGRLIIQYGQVTTYNANRPHGFGILDPETFAPYSKNPVIGAFFREIDRADELGSGMRKLMKYGKKYGGADPMLIEGDVFRMIIRVPEFGADISSQTRVGQDTPPVNTYVRRLLELLESSGSLGNAEILTGFKLKDRRRLRETYIVPALGAGLIAYTIPDKPSSSNQKYRLTEKGR